MELAKPPRCDVAAMGRDPVGPFVLPSVGLGVVCLGVGRPAIRHRRWLGPSLESQLSW